MRLKDQVKIVVKELKALNITITDDVLIAIVTTIVLTR